MSRFSVVAFVWLSVGLAAPASAQVPQPFPDLPPRPYGGVFGGNAENSAGFHHTLDAVLALFGGNDVNVGDPTSVGFSDPESVIGGPYSAGGAALSYAWRGRRVIVGASASSRTRYYRDLGSFLAASHAGGAGFEASLGSRTRIQAQQTIAATPLFGIDPFPVLGAPDLGQAAPPNADMALATRDVLLSATSAGFSRVLTGRSTVGLGYEFNASQYSSPIQDLKVHTVTSRWDRRLSPRGFAGVLYSFREGQYDFDGVVSPFRTQEAHLELEQQWIHSRTRRTSARVTLGGALIDVENRRLVRPVGGVQVSTLLGQSWDVRTGYRRSVEPIPGLPDVTYLDTVGVSAQGLLTRWVDLRLAAGYADGTVGVSDVPDRYTSYGGSARVGIAVHKLTAVFAEVFYYYNSGSLLTASDVDGRRERRGFRAGVSWWLPIVRQRSADGSR